MGLFDRRKREERKPEAAETAAEELASGEEQFDEPATLYRATHLAVVPAGNDVLLQDPDRETPIVLPAFELDLLAQCTHFAPIEEHAAGAAARTGLPADGVARQLYEMVDRGLLVSKRDVMTRARDAAAADADAPPTLDRVAVITANRPGSLAACLQSYRERYGADIELIVFDDSADPASRVESRRVAAEAGAGGRILYAGEEEKRQFVAELAAKSGVEQDIVSTALTEFDGLGFHAGANRNAVLLDAAGGAVLMVDDDTTARVASPIDAGDGFRLSSRYDPLSLHFFSDVGDALGAADWQDVDLLAWHRHFLGKSPAACAFGAAAHNGPLPLDTDGGALDLNEADAALIGAFSRGRGRVVMTCTGFVGDSGMGAPFNFLWLQGSERERLLLDYESHRATRGVHRCADVATVTSTSFLMAPNGAIDVRTLIPPFCPVLRNEDGAFGSMLRACGPESFLAFLPWSVEHSPPDARSADWDHVVHSVARVHANSIIRDLAAGYEPTPGIADPAARLSAFGRYLNALGTMVADDFDAFVRNHIMVAVGRRIEALTRAVEHHGDRPDSWANDCAAVMEEGLRALTEDSLIVCDVPGSTSDERYRRFQRLLHRFGRLIDAWPALLNAAKDLRVAKPISSS
jgi:hypothetical protein